MAIEVVAVMGNQSHPNKSRSEAGSPMSAGHIRLPIATGAQFASAADPGHGREAKAVVGQLKLPCRETDKNCRTDERGN
jgi:hypothetical protein